MTQADGGEKEEEAKKEGEEEKKMQLHLNNPGAEVESFSAHLKQPKRKEKERIQWGGKGINAYLMKTGLDWEHTLIWVRLVQAWNQKNLEARTYSVHMNTHLIRGQAIIKDSE